MTRFEEDNANLEKPAYTINQHRDILKNQGISYFENWKPAPKYTSDGTGTGDAPKDSDDED